MKIALKRRLRPNKAASSSGEAKTKAQRVKEAGQVIAIFALALMALIGLVGFAIDLTFTWREELRIQRAADAAALAGVVYLPGDVSNGMSAASAEARKNGYTTGTNGTTVTAAQNATNVREMDVSIRTNVPTFFFRVFGVDHFTVARSSKAVYVLPVPMGSPDPYYGAYGNFKMKNASGADTTVTMTSPGGSAITGRGFWATMLTQGAGAASGDAFLPARLNANQTTSSPANPGHDTENYYDYGIYVPPGSSGNVYIFDPVFCATDGRYGSGDFYLVSSNVTTVSSYFYLYNTNNQPYNPDAHTLIASTGPLFANDKYSDSRANAPSLSGTTSCTGPSSTYPTSDPRHWHNTWMKLNTSALSGGTGGAMYRLRTTTYPGTNSSANAYNDFAIYSDAPGAEVYGLGAMEMYTLLPASTTSELYLAQVDAQSGAGKTIQVRLWDVGDTNGLNNSQVQVLSPTSSGWSPVSMSWSATKVATSDVGPCPSGSGTAITTFTGGTKQYNGCWLTINVVVPTSYTAPQHGWWKIRYVTGSGSTDMSTDLTTWMVDIRGNPVHLIP